MYSDKTTKTFTVTATEEVMARFERFLALLHYNSSFGHTSLFAMHLDGDGSDRLQVKEIDGNLAHEVDAIGGVGYNVEIAGNKKYYGVFIDHEKGAPWYTGNAANLYKDGKVVKTIPSADHGHSEGASPVVEDPEPEHARACSQQGG